VSNWIDGIPRDSSWAKSDGFSISGSSIKAFLLLFNLFFEKSIFVIHMNIFCLNCGKYLYLELKISERQDSIFCIARGNPEPEWDFDLNYNCQQVSIKPDSNASSCINPFLYYFQIEFPCQKIN